MTEGFGKVVVADATCYMKTVMSLVVGMEHDKLLNFSFKSSCERKQRW